MKKVLPVSFLLFLLFITDVNGQNPEISVPERFFAFRLSNPASPDVAALQNEYIEHLYKEASKSSYRIEPYAKYLTADPDSKRFKEIANKIFDKKRFFGLERELNFSLHDEYKKRFPQGEYYGIKDSFLLLNELRFLKDIYLLAPVQRVIAVARERGVDNAALHEILALEEELISFEHLDATDINACESFINKYPKCPKTEIIRQQIFERISSGTFIGDSLNYATTPGQLIRWVPYKESEVFYSKVWDALKRQADGKTIEQQLQVLHPWITTSDYRFGNAHEKLFLTDILTWAAVLHLQKNNVSDASISYLTGAAIAHTIHKDLFLILLSRMFDLNNLDLNKMQADMNQKRQKGEISRRNIQSTRQLLYVLGVASFFINSIEQFQTILKQTDTENKTELENALESAKTELKKRSVNNSEINKTCHRLLYTLFEADANAWPALEALLLFPDASPMEAVVSMPRFYDYEESIESYLTTFKKESIDLAKKWLSTAGSSDLQIERAFFILGFHRQFAGADSKGLDEKSNPFYNYYKIQTNTCGSNICRERLLEAAGKKNKIALVLYTKIMGNEQTPEPLFDWLKKEVSVKKFMENQAIHIFHPVVKALKEPEREMIVDEMYTSYNFEWKDFASSYYKEWLSSNLSDAIVKSTLNGEAPWKKADLINFLASKKDNRFADDIAGYLEGNFYTPGDKSYIRRNLENMFTKDIQLGYNQRIDYSAVKKAVDEGENLYKSILIQTAAGGLELLPFNRAAEVLTRRFLNDDFLCVYAAQWLKDHRSGASPETRSLLENVRPKSDLQRAVLAFLNALFSDSPDYDEYVKLTKKLKHTEKWIGLVNLGIPYVKKETFATLDDAAGIANPVKDWTLEQLLSNIKNRYLLLLGKID